VAVVVVGALVVLGACGDGSTTAVDRPTPVLRLAPAPPTATEPVDLAVTPTEPATTTTTVPPAPRRLTLAFTGDTLIHSTVVRRAQANAGGNGYDFRPMFARIAPLVSSVDLAVCHIETPVAPPGEALSTYPRFGVPAELALGLASAGYDRCSTASNHAIDRGVAGVDATVTALELAGLDQSGMARTPGEAVPTVFEVNGVRVVHLSYTFSFNGLRLPADQLWRSPLIDPFRIVGDAIDARNRGAEVVIASLHWGTEGSSAVSAWQRQMAELITSSGQVDLIVGHHAHVLQPIEQVNGRWVVYGLGNVVSNMHAGPNWTAASEDGAVVTVAVDEQPDGSFVVEQPVVHPTWVDRAGGYVIRPVLTDLADPATSAGVHGALSASLERTAALLGPYLAAVG
jgi:poly-gamma-glutamate synthesis protein (capsule biosynthesis protein)